MGKANSWSQELLDLLFLNVAAAHIGDSAGLQPSATTGSLYVSLHTADPTASGNQGSSEATYTSYARVAVARTSGGWARTGQTVSPVATISFPACTGGTNTLTYFGVGTDSTGAGTLLYSGTVTPSISVSSGITPQLTTASTITES